MQTKPVARSEGLLLETVGDETVVYDTTRKEAHCLSPLAGVIFANCDGKTSIEDLAGLASDRVGEPIDADRVLESLAQLGERELLATTEGGLSRRDVMKRGALVGGAVAAAPLISSVMVPVPAAAATPTCGDILCCPCFQGQPPNPGLPNQGQACCDHPSAGNCTCTAAEVGGCKQCKPGGPAATTSLCSDTFGPNTIFPPATAPCPCPKNLIPDCQAIP